MLPDPGLLASILCGAVLGAAMLLLIAGWRGVREDPARPVPGWRRWLAVARSPALAWRVAAAVLAGVATLVATRWPVAAVAIGVLVISWPHLFGGPASERLAIARLQALVVWTESLRDTVSANVSLEQAIPHSIERAPELISPALQRLAGQMLAWVPLEEALYDLAADLDDPDADIVIAALVANVLRRGAGLKGVLTDLVVTAREDLELRTRITAGRAGPRRAVQIVVILTVAVVGYLSVFGGGYLAPYATAGGQVALAVVAALFGSGFVWMRGLAGTGQDKTPFLARPDRPADPVAARIVAAVTALPMPGPDRVSRR